MEPTVEMQQSGRLQNDGGTKGTCRAHEQCTHAGNDPIRDMRVGRTFCAPIEDEQLMLDQHGFGDGTESTRRRQPGQGDDQMNEQIAKSHIRAMVSTPQNHRNQANLAIRQRHHTKIISTAFASEPQCELHRSPPFVGGQ
jgi:hypothetical protein